VEKNYEKPGVESKLVGISLILSFILIEGGSRLGLFGVIKTYWARSVFIEAIVVIPGLAFLIWDKKQFVSMLRINPVKIRVILLAVLVEICAMPLMALCNIITESFTTNTAGVAISTMMGDTPYILMIMAMGAVPAILEELLSRGLYLSAFKRSGRVMPAIIFAALCFAISHGNINQFAYAFVIGTVMGLVVEATGSVITSIAMHFFTNAFSITIMYYAYYADIAIEQTNELLGTGDNKIAELMVDSEAMEMFETTMKITTILIVAGLAILGIVGIYKLLGRMALICGRYEHMRSFLPQAGIFRMRNGYLDDMLITDASKAREEALPKLPCTRIMNPLLAVGILLWLGQTVVYELVVHGVINLN